jgi:hypothetical protein
MAFRILQAGILLALFGCRIAWSLDCLPDQGICVGDKVFFDEAGHFHLGTVQLPLPKEPKILDISYNQCLAGGKVNIVISPAAIRFYESTAWTVLYFGLRNLQIHQ